MEQWALSLLTTLDEDQRTFDCTYWTSRAIRLLASRCSWRIGEIRRDTGRPASRVPRAARGTCPRGHLAGALSIDAARRASAREAHCSVLLDLCLRLPAFVILSAVSPRRADRVHRPPRFSLKMCSSACAKSRTKWKVDPSGVQQARQRARVR